MILSNFASNLSSLPEESITAIIQSCQNELWVRRERAKLRQRWVERKFSSYINHPNATALQVDPATIVVAMADFGSGVHMAKAVCLPGDTFDLRVGIAVAYAKLCGEKIPDYI